MTMIKGHPLSIFLGWDVCHTRPSEVTRMVTLLSSKIRNSEVLILDDLRKVVGEQA